MERNNSKQVKEKKMYTHDQVLESSTEYFGGDELAASVFAGKYALQDSEGNFLEKNPNDMHKRLASEFSRVESKYPNPMSYDEIYRLLEEFKYVVPQGSPMSGIGNDTSKPTPPRRFII